MERGLTPLTPNEFEDLANTIDTLIIDTRKPEIFRVGLIPRSIFIGIDGDFAPWVDKEETNYIHCAGGLSLNGCFKYFKIKGL